MNGVSEQIGLDRSNRRQTFDGEKKKEEKHSNGSVDPFSRFVLGFLFSLFFFVCFGAVSWHTRPPLLTHASACNDLDNKGPSWSARERDRLPQPGEPADGERRYALRRKKNWKKNNWETERPRIDTTKKTEKKKSFLDG